MYISITNIRKSFKKDEILKGISFEFKDSKKYLIVGENGIGKSTLFKAILNQIKYEGYIEIDGRISYSPDGGALPHFMSSYNFIKTFSTLSDDVVDFDKKCDYYLSEFNIQKKKNSILGSMSKGERQKVNIIKSLMTPSEILILDEPLSGLDELSRKKLLNILINDERMVIVVSHEKEEFDKRFFNCLVLKDGLLEVLSKVH